MEERNDFPINDCQVKTSDTTIKTSNVIGMRLVGLFQKPCGNYLILVRLTVERLLYNFVSSTSVGLNSEKCFSKPDVDCKIVRIFAILTNACGTQTKDLERV